MMINFTKKLLVICGPTATGKTTQALDMAKKFNGEIISADSRQVYQGMNIGTGKDIPLNSKFQNTNSKTQTKIQKDLNIKVTVGKYKINNIPIWGYDLVKPNEDFSVNHWVKIAKNIIYDIWQRKKLPIVVGGTGFWIKVLIEGVETLGIPPDWKLREKLSNYQIIKLSNLLEKIDKNRWQQMNKSDRNNPRRLVRAIEVFRGQNKFGSTKAKKLNFNKLLIIGFQASNKFLYNRIDRRVDQRICQGAEREVKQLLKKGYGWDLPAMTATGYREWSEYFDKKEDLAEVIQKWKNNEHAYARRQLTWFKKYLKQMNHKNFQASWINIEAKDWQKVMVKLITNWYDIC